MHLTYIEWDDATSPNSGPWIDAGDPQLDISAPMVIVSVGFVIQENEHYVQLASSSDLVACIEKDWSGSQVGGIMTIPQRQVSKRVELDIKAPLSRTKRVEYKKTVGKKSI